MNQIESLVLTLVGESLDSPDVFVEGSQDYALLRDSVNNGIAELALTTGFVTQTYLFPLRTDRQFYRMRWTKDSFLYVIEAYDRKNHRRLTQTTISELGEWNPRWQEDYGPPQQYAQIGYDMIAVYPRPSSGGQVIELRCAVVPMAYSDSDSVPKVREAFETAVAYYAASEYYASRGDATRAADYMKQAYETAGTYKYTTQYQAQMREAVNGRPLYR